MALSLELACLFCTELKDLGKLFFSERRAVSLLFFGSWISELACLLWCCVMLKSFRLPVPWVGEGESGGPSTLPSLYITVMSITAFDVPRLFPLL